MLHRRSPLLGRRFRARNLPTQAARSPGRKQTSRVVATENAARRRAGAVVHSRATLRLLDTTAGPEDCLTSSSRQKRGCERPLDSLRDRDPHVIPTIRRTARGGSRSTSSSNGAAARCQRKHLTSRSRPSHRANGMTCQNWLVMPYVSRHLLRCK